MDKERAAAGARQERAKRMDRELTQEMAVALGSCSEYSSAILVRKYLIDKGIQFPNDDIAFWKRGKEYKVITRFGGFFVERYEHGKNGTYRKDVVSGSGCSEFDNRGKDSKHFDIYPEETPHVVHGFIKELLR